MPDYKTLYFKLFAAMSDAMEIIEKAQKEAEEYYLISCEEDAKNIIDLKSINKKKK